MPEQTLEKLDAHTVGPNIPPPENKLVYPAIDGLRAVAALMIFFHHYSRGLPQATRWGWIGVNIFFVLSGFLITGILFDTRNHPHRFRNFYVRRALRVFPLYYGVFAVLWLLTPFLHWAWDRTSLLWLVYLGNWLYFLPGHAGVATHTMLPPDLVSRSMGLAVNWGHFWTLCIEEQFYFAWPLVVFFVKDRVRLRNLCFAIIAAVLCLRFAVTLHFTPETLGHMLQFYTPFQIDGLLVGAALALMLRGPEAGKLLRSAGPTMAATCGVFAVTWLVAVQVLHQIFSAAPTVPWIETMGFTLIDIVAASVLLFSLVPGNIFYRTFSLQPLRSLGKISYGFYVFHFLPRDFYEALAAHMLKRPAEQHLLADAIAFACTLVLSYLSFRFFETPFLRLKDRFTL